MRRESGEPEAQESRGLALQSVELRRQLQEEQASYRRKLQAYQEGQQRQAQLVQRLQAKVGLAPRPPRTFPPPTPTPAADPLSAHPQILQCKKKSSETEQQLLERCTELEQLRLRVGAGGLGGRADPSCPAHSDALASRPLRTQGTARTWRAPSSAWRRSSRGGPAGGARGPAALRPGTHLLSSASPRSASLAQVNALLREQLDQASSANQALRDDIRKVTSDWARSRQELEQREAAWRREGEVGQGPGSRGPAGLAGEGPRAS